MIYIISDDLTGANDTGVQYTKQGFKTLVTVKTDENFLNLVSKNYDVISINADTRAMLPQDAYRTVFELVKKFKNDKVEYIYKKIDSLVRGNPGVELDAVMDAIEAKTAIVATSYPEVGRKLVNGRFQLIDGDGSNSVINVIDVFSKDMKRRVIGVNLSIVREGAEKVVEFVNKGARDGYQVFVIDAVEDNDLAIIKEAALLMKYPPILCGSAGLAKQLSLDRKKTATKPTDNKLREKSKSTLIMIGSRNNITSLQMKALEEEMGVPKVTIFTEDVFNGSKDKMMQDIVDQVNSLMTSGCRLLAVVVDTLFSEFKVQLKDQEQYLMDSMSIAKTIGELSRIIYESNPIDTIISSGGDTSQQILEALGAKGVLLENEIISGIPIGKIIEGIADGSTIITKSGGFGDKDSLIKTVEFLGYGDERQLEAHQTL